MEYKVTVTPLKHGQFEDKPAKVAYSIILDGHKKKSKKTVLSPSRNYFQVFTEGEYRVNFSSRKFEWAVFYFIALIPVGMPIFMYWQQRQQFLNK